jgi:hypothetical protein
MDVYIRTMHSRYSGTTRFVVFSGTPENHSNNEPLDMFPTRRSAERYISTSGHTLVSQRQPAYKKNDSPEPPTRKPDRGMAR